MTEEYTNENLVVEECAGCDNVVGDNCKVYNKPYIWWRHKDILGGDKGYYCCPMATHVKRTSTAPKGKVRVGQQKQMKK